MYYDEQVIDNVLCWRNSPDGDWQPFSAVALTRMLLAARDQINKPAK